MQADGKLIVGGAFTTIGGQAKAHIARLNADGSVDTTFTAGADAEVYSIVVQDDGQILVGGAFTTIGGQTRNHIARLNSDGTAESGFDPDADNNVRAIALLLNGDIIIGGDFTSLNNTTTPLPRNYIARLDAGNGSVDPDYIPNANGSVYALATQRNGKVVVGGAFTAIGGQSRNYIARLKDNNGVAETVEFNISADGAVRSIVIQTDGKILIGGEFTTLSDPNGTHTRNRIALLDANGDTDFNFDPDSNGIVHAIVLQPDGKILVGGEFTSIGGISINRMARLGIEFGSADLSFTSDVGGTVHTITVQADEKIFIGGAFTSLTEGATVHTRNYLARLHTNGSVEVDFAITSIVNTNDYATISSITVQNDGKILIGGSFSQIDGTARKNIARFNPDGTIDTTFTADTNGHVSSIIVQTDNKILVGGDFTTISGSTIPYLARLNSDGTVDPSFSPGPNSVVHAIALQSDGKIIVGGQFSTIGGGTSNNIARLFTSGTIDSGYLTTATNGPIYTLLIQPDGKLLVGGSFTKIGGQGRKHLARLDVTGEVDTTTEFKNTGTDNTVRALALEADGKIIVGGDFTVIDSKARNHIARLGTDGNIDLTFDPNANGIVRAIAVQTDTNILIGGDFTTIGGQPRISMARLGSNGVVESGFIADADAAVNTIVVQGNGKILAGGEFTAIIDGEGTSFPRNRIAQLSIDLSVDTFDPGITGTHFSAVVVQSDGKILVGGTFTAIKGTNRSNLARLNSDGTVDTTFSADTNGAVNSIVIQADNTILVSGAFTTIGGQAIPYLAKLNSDGTVATGFTPSPDGVVYAIAVQNDGKIIVGGQFTTIGGLTRANLARLLSTGTGDSTYTTTADDVVYSLVIQPTDGKLVVGGAFLNIGGKARNRLARLSTTGVVDTTTAFKNTGTDLAVRVLALQADGAILVGGDFTSIDSQARNYFARLLANGDLDLTFDPNANGAVRAITVQTDTNILVGGAFTAIGGQPRNSLARLGSNGVAESGFIADADAVVRAIVVQDDGKVLVGGEFTTVAGQTRNYIARVKEAGTVDSVFLADAVDIPAATISAITIQGNGKFLVGGIFSHINGIARSNIARLEQNGAVDTTWTTTVDGEVTSIVILSNGKILICGDFTSITDINATYTRNYLARLNSDGTVDQKFYPEFHGRVLAIAEEASPVNEINGDILVAGEFSTVMIPTGNTGSVTNNFYQRPFIARLKNPDDPDNPTAPYPTLNTTFPNSANYPNNVIRTIALQPDGQIIVGGDFTWIGDLPRNMIARISKSGGLSDSTFDPNSNGIVRSILVQPDGNILVGGDFTYIGNQTRNKIARLYSDSAKADEFAPNADASVRSIAIDTDGNILAIGDFTNIGGQARNHIARLTPILGTADDFNPGVGLNPQATISAIAVQKDGKVVVGGNFSTIDSQARNRMARLSADTPALQGLTLSTDGTKITWHRSQSSPEIHDVVFYESANNQVWLKIADVPTRITGGWELTVASGILFQRQNRYIAASAKTSGGFYNGSTSSIQTVRQYFIDYYTLTITPKPTTGIVETDLGNIACGLGGTDVCSEAFQADTALTLTATPLEYGYVAFDGQKDYIFSSWGGTTADCGNGTTNPLSVILDQNRNCKANFVAAYTSLLDIDPAGSGSGTVDWQPVNRIDGLAPAGKVYESGKIAYVTAVADQGSVFTGWSGNCSGKASPFELTMNKDKSCTATFEEARTLTITKSGTGSGTVSGAGDYALGAKASASATADPGSKFTGWSGDCSGTASPVNVIMDADKTCVANFEIAWVMTVNKTGSGDGTVGGDGLYVAGETATVSAVPNSASLFTGWSGDCSGTTSPLDVTMDSDKTCVATFALKRTLTITKSGTGSGTVSGDGIYADGATASASAIADDGSKFIGWTGDCSGTTSPVSITMDSDKTCDAEFELGYYNLTVTNIGDGDGIVHGPGIHPEGTTVTVSATPAPGSLFAGWGGDCGTGTTSPITVLMDSSKNCTVSFRLPKLTVTLSGNGTGAVTSDDGLIDCPGVSCSQEYALTDPPVTLTAVPDAGFIFTGWEGNGINCPGTDPCTVTMDSYRDITATFRSPFSWNLFLPAITKPR